MTVLITSVAEYTAALQEIQDIRDIKQRLSVEDGERLEELEDAVYEFSNNLLEEIDM
jgi:hypothetical protein